MASDRPVAPHRTPACRVCAAALARCWVCGEVARCPGCQQCLRCEGLLGEAVAGRARTPDLPVRVPAVRLKRPDRAATAARPRPAGPVPPPSSPAAGRTRARRVQDSPSLSPLATAVWYTRAAVVPLLMLACGYGAYGYFRQWSGLSLAAASVVSFYLPYVLLTPVRRKGDFFPLGDEGPALPLAMVIGGGIVGMIAGIVLGVVLGEWVGRWSGIAAALITFHAVYFFAVSQAAAKAR